VSKDHADPFPRAIRWCLFIVIGAILLATLLPAAPEAARASPWCVACGEGGVADFILNFGLFLPLGMVLGVAGVRARSILAICGAFSTAIELAQEFIPGRDTSLGDIIANTGGAWIGALIVIGIHQLIIRQRLSGLVSIGAAIFAMGAICTTGVLVEPNYPPTSYYGQWTAEQGGMDWYRGRVVAATLGSMALPSWRFDDQARVHTLMQDGAPVNILAIAGPSTRRLAPIFSVADDRGQEILLIGVRGVDLVVRYRTRSRAWGLDQPYTTIPRAFANYSVGDTMHISLTAARGVHCASVNTTEACPLGFTAGAGWSFLYPARLPGWLRTALGIVWVGVLLAPVGFAAPTVRTLAIGGSLAFTGLATIPGLVGLLATPPVEWLGAAGGLLSGWIVRRLVASRVGRPRAAVRC